MQINPHAKVWVDSGFDVPVLYVEDFYQEPELVRARALELTYESTASRYPGLQATAVGENARDAVRTLVAIADRLCDFSFHAEDVESDFAIVKTAAEDLVPVQHHPHIDPWPLFGLVYLTPGSSEGTSFYSSDILGFTVARTQEQRDAHEQFVQFGAAEGHDGSGEINAPRLWRKRYSIQPVFNRLVLFPGNVLHAIDLQSERRLESIARVRLTQRFIIRNIYRKR
jgi:hypothetical protein